jgi:hypothetical protein
LAPPNVEKMKASRDIDGLIKALSHQKADYVRIEAAAALVQIGDARAVMPLLAMLKDSNPRAHLQALVVLGFVGARLEDAALCTRVVNTLIAANYTYEKDMTEQRAMALVRIGKPSIEPLLPQFENLLAQINRLSFWYGSLWDAVELVDWRNGEIRPRTINQWLAEETLKGFQQLSHPRIRKLVEGLEKQLPEMLTFLDGIVEPLTDWQAQAVPYFQDHSSAAYFQASVARFWRLEHAVQRNGHQNFHQAALEAQQFLTAWIEDDPQLKRLAEKLLNILERTVRTSCAAETINSVLRPYLVRRRECTDLVSRQLFLNLFVLWFNLHKFDRGPRKGKSPYEIAGIDLGTDDWLTLLGYPPDLC